jgi:hypothetical protein
MRKAAALALLVTSCAFAQDDGAIVDDDLEDPGFEPVAQALTGACVAAKPVAVSASADDGDLPANTLDGDLTTRWSALGVGSWIRYDLGGVRALCGLGIAWYKGDQRSTQFVVDVSQDGTTWTRATSGRTSGASLALERSAISNLEARYVRITGNGNSDGTAWTSITEVEIDATPATTPPLAGAIDADGVVELYAPATSGASWHLGTQHLETAANFDVEWAKGTAQITHATQAGVPYWTVPTTTIHYASGGDGRTVRFNIHASGGAQKYTWLNTPGYLSNAQDLKNVEATAYLRVRAREGTSHQSLSWKVRGGAHTSSDGNLASCTQMGVPFDGTAATAARELVHPTYDYVALSARFGYSVAEGQWLAIKIVSWVNPDGKSTTNRLYLDTAPFTAAGAPRNEFRLYSEWIDRQGDPTQNYTTAATWGGWLTTMRIDGYDLVDLALLSAREIVRPQ